MKSAGLLRPLAIAFGFAVVIYVVAFSCIEHHRTGNGPWQITFEAVAGRPVVVINQPALRIRDVRIVFAAETAGSNLVQRLSFDQVRLVPFVVPYGQCVFQDAQSMPGTLVFQLFGHEIQLLPRVLTIDRAEHPWHTSERIVLSNAPVQRN